MQPRLSGSGSLTEMTGRDKAVASQSAKPRANEGARCCATTTGGKSGGRPRSTCSSAGGPPVDAATAISSTFGPSFSFGLVGDGDGDGDSDNGDDGGGAIGVIGRVAIG